MNLQTGQPKTVKTRRGNKKGPWTKQRATAGAPLTRKIDLRETVAAFSTSIQTNRIPHRSSYQIAMMTRHRHDCNTHSVVFVSSDFFATVGGNFSGGGNSTRTWDPTDRRAQQKKTLKRRPKLTNNSRKHVKNY